MILLFLWTVISSWRYYILVSYGNIRHLHNADSWFCPGFSGSSSNLQKWLSSQHGSVRSLFFLFFFQGILINPFYFCLFCFPIYLFNKNKHIHDTKYVHMAMWQCGATLFDNFFLWWLKVHELKCTFRHLKIQILYYMYLWETSGAP